MNGIIIDSQITSAGIVQFRRNPRAPTIEPLEPMFRLRAEDGRYLNIDGSGFTDGPHRYIATERRTRAMRKVNALAAGCKIVRA